MFSKNDGVKESNEVEVIAIWKPLGCSLALSNLSWLCFFLVEAKLIVERDFANGVMRALCLDSRQWRFQFYFNEIKELSSHLDVFFCYVLRSANSMADGLPKQAPMM